MGKRIFKKVNIVSVILLTSIIIIVTIKAISHTNDKIDYIIELNKFNISSNYTNAKDTTEGINKALEYAKEQGYKTVKLPEGHYEIDTSIITPIVLSDGEKEWTDSRKGIVMQSDMELILNDAILEMIPTNDPYYSILTISDCNNSKITGGTIIGDRDTHDYGLRINELGDELESGSYDENTGLPIEDESKVRTKDFIENFKGGAFPEQFVLSVLENTTKNTVDGGVRYIYCYDENEKYLGIAEGGNGFLSKTKLIVGTKKIKVSFKDEKRLDAKYYITEELIYPTHEFGSGITITASSNIEINEVTIKDTIGDCILTAAPPLDVTVDDLSIIDCTLENSRRQGISLVATGQNYLIKDCNIGKVNGVDPQSGIDIEHYNYVKDVIIEGNSFYDNKKWDIINYNGQDIEIKENSFTGGVASTFGWNMNINNNNFEYSDTKGNPKIHPGCAISLGTDKTDDIEAYFKFNNNTIKNYEKAGGIQGLRLNEFTNNKIYNTENLVVRAPITNNNLYENSYVRYDTALAEEEEFINSIVDIESDKSNTIINNSNFKESQYMPRGKTTIKNSNIYNKELSFGDTSAWWGLDKNVVFDNCEIRTEYNEDTQFLSNYCAKSLFKDCNMNLSRYTFSLNYGVIEFDNCNIEINDINTDKNEVNFDRIVYGGEENYWDIKNSNFTTELPLKINTRNVDNSLLNENLLKP